MTQFKVEKRDIIMMGIRSTYYMVEAESAEEAEQMILDDDNDADPYDSDTDIRETEHLDFITSEN
jgi:hypothetical protein